MNWHQGMALTAAVLSAAVASKAMGQAGGLSSSRASQLLLYRTLYQGPREQREQQMIQRNFQMELDRVRDSQYRASTAEDPVDRLFREGRISSRAGTDRAAKPLPPIYSGNAVNRQYFMRTNSFGAASQSQVQRPNLMPARRPPRRFF